MVVRPCGTGQAAALLSVLGGGYRVCPPDVGAELGWTRLPSSSRVPKVVFSSTLEAPLLWANAQLVSGDAAEAVAAMKRDGTNMSTLGSLTLCRSLIEAGLVDRFRVVVFPVITGSTGSERIYDGYPDVALEMVASRTFDGRIQLLRVRPHGAQRPAPRRVGVAA